MALRIEIIQRFPEGYLFLAGQPRSLVAVSIAVGVAAFQLSQGCLAQVNRIGSLLRRRRGFLARGLTLLRLHLGRLLETGWW
jgi:hypothetical protein